ncbi:uncharacterized protein LOC128635298 isoform X2 [Ictalurus punctatus]|nr:uncharacterized protein LOC128635298 isoform X2 [Ictalurus punctatus]XP_053543448.1 uncharacterized protein LOC128635298 isoform X2 [Ictalurus punctatus]
MAAHLSGGARPLSLRHGVRCEVSSEVSLEQVLMAVGELIKCENIVAASRMNKAVVMFVKERELVHQLAENGIKRFSLLGRREPGANPRERGAQGRVHPGQGASPSKGTLTYTLTHPFIHLDMLIRLPRMWKPEYLEETPAAPNHPPTLEV